MSLADRVAQKADRALSKYGEALTLTRRATSAYDPNTSAPTETVTTYAFRGMPEAVSDVGRGDREIPAGSSVQQARWKVSVAADALPIVPEPGDEVGLIDGQTWKVIAVTHKARMTGRSILYELRVAA